MYTDSEDRVKYRKFTDGFHPQDGGMLVLGETCHNRTLLFSIANNWIIWSQVGCLPLRSPSGVDG